MDNLTLTPAKLVEWAKLAQRQGSPHVVVRLEADNQIVMGLGDSTPTVSVVPPRTN